MGDRRQRHRGGRPAGDDDGPRSRNYGRDRDRDEEPPSRPRDRDRRRDDEDRPRDRDRARNYRSRSRSRDRRGRDSDRHQRNRSRSPRPRDWGRATRDDSPPPARDRKNRDRRDRSPRAVGGGRDVRERDDGPPARAGRGMPLTFLLPPKFDHSTAASRSASTSPSVKTFFTRPDGSEINKAQDRGRDRHARRSDSPPEALPTRPKGKHDAAAAGGAGRNTPVSFRVGGGQDGDGEEAARPAGLDGGTPMDVEGVDGEEGEYVEQDDDVEVEDDGMAAMQAMMGFGGFGTTKNKKVLGNNVGGVHKEKKTEYRQYMNRPGGFNRPLSPSR